MIASGFKYDSIAWVSYRMRSEVYRKLEYMGLSYLNEPLTLCCVYFNPGIVLIHVNVINSYLGGL